MTGVEIGAAVGGSLIFGYLLRKGMVRDVKAIHKFEEMIVKQPKWTHKQKVAELKGESWLNDKYLEKLIQNSRSKYDLKEIENHIRATRVHDHLLKKVRTRIDELEFQEFIRVLMKKGSSIVEEFIV